MSRRWHPPADRTLRIELRGFRSDTMVVSDAARSRIFRTDARLLSGIASQSRRSVAAPVGTAQCTGPWCSAGVRCCTRIRLALARSWMRKPGWKPVGSIVMAGDVVPSQSNGCAETGRTPIAEWNVRRMGCCRAAASGARHSLECEGDPT